MRGALIVVGFVVAGLVGALAGHVLFPSEDTPPADPGRLARLERRLAELAGDVARLEAGARRERTAPAMPEAPPRPPGEIEDGRDAVSRTDPAASPLPPALVPEAEIEEKVRETIEEYAREQREENERQIEAKQVATEVAWLAKVRGPLGLTDLQVEEILRMMRERRVITSRLKAEYAALGPAPDPDDVDLLNQRYADLGRAREAELRSLLSPAQFEGLMEAAPKGQGRK